MFQIKNLSKELHNNGETEEDVEITTQKKRYVSPEERQQIIDELRLVLKNYWWIDVNTIVHVWNTLVALQYIKNGIPKNSEFVRKCIESTI